METVRNADHAAAQPRALGMAFLVILALLAWSAFDYARASDAVEICKASPRAFE